MNTILDDVYSQAKNLTKKKNQGMSSLLNANQLKDISLIAEGWSPIGVKFEFILNSVIVANLRTI